MKKGGHLRRLPSLIIHPYAAVLAAVVTLVTECVSAADGSRFCLKVSNVCARQILHLVFVVSCAIPGEKFSWLRKFIEVSSVCISLSGPSQGLVKAPARSLARYASFFSWDFFGFAAFDQTIGEVTLATIVGRFPN